MANQEITTDQKADLLFKEFNGVADTWHAGNYAQQLYKFSDKVLGDNILTDTIPVTLPAGYDVASLDSLGVSQAWSNGQTSQIPGYPQLEFVFRLELYPVVQSQELTYSAPPGFCNVAGGGGVPSELENAIPFLFDAVYGDYNSMVFTKDPNQPHPAGYQLLQRDPQNQGAAVKKPYVFDTKNGFVTFYPEAGPDPANPYAEFFSNPPFVSANAHPYISFIRYKGNVGLGAIGNQSWLDASFNNVDISGQLKVYNDASMTTATIKDLKVAYRLNTANSYTDYRFFDNTDFSSNYTELIPASSGFTTGPQTVCIAHTVGQWWSTSSSKEQGRVSSAVFDVFERSTEDTASATTSSESFLTFKVTRYLRPSGGSGGTSTFTEFGGCCTVQVLNYNNQNPSSISPRFTKVIAEVAEIEVWATNQYVSQYVCNILLQREMEINPSGNKDYNTKIEVRCRDNMLLQREESLASDQQAYFLLSPHRNFEPDASFNGQPIKVGGTANPSNPQPQTRYLHEVNLQDGTTFSNWGNLKSYELTCGGGGINANGQSVDNVSVVRGSNNSNRVELNTANIDIETDTSGDIRFGLATWTSGGYAPRFECGNANLGELNMGAPQGSGNYKNAITNVVDICGTSGANALPLTIKSFNSSKPIVVSTHPTYDGYFNGWTSKNIIIRSAENWGIDIGAGFRSTANLVATTAAPEQVLIRTGNNDPPKKYSFLNNVFDVCGNNIANVDNLDASSINQSTTTNLEIGNVTGPSQTTFKGRANFETPATLMYDSSINIASAMTTNGDIAVASNTNLGKGSIMYRSNNINRVLFPGEVYFKLGVEMVSGSSGYDFQTNGGTPSSPANDKKMLPLDTMVLPNISVGSYLRNDTPYVLNIEGVSIELCPYQCWTTQGNNGNTFDAAINFQIWIYGGVDGQTPWGSGNPTPSPQRIQQSNSGGSLYQDILVPVRGVGGAPATLTSGVSAATATYKRCFAEANPATNSNTIFASCNSRTYRHEFVETPVAVTTGLPGGGTTNSQGTYWYPGTRLYIKNNNICDAVTNWTGSGTVNLSNVKSRYRITNNNVGGGLWGANVATIRARPVGLA